MKLNKNSNLDCVQTMPADFENGKKVTDKPPLHTKTGHVLPADFENGRFENETLTDTFWQWHRVNTRK